MMRNLYLSTLFNLRRSLVFRRMNIKCLMYEIQENLYLQENVFN